MIFFSKLPSKSHHAQWRRKIFICLFVGYLHLNSAGFQAKLKHL